MFSPQRDLRWWGSATLGYRVFLQPNAPSSCVSKDVLFVFSADRPNQRVCPDVFFGGTLALKGLERWWVPQQLTKENTSPEVFHLIHKRWMHQLSRAYFVSSVILECLRSQRCWCPLPWEICFTVLGGAWWCGVSWEGLPCWSGAGRGQKRETGQSGDSCSPFLRRSNCWSCQTSGNFLLDPSWVLVPGLIIKLTEDRFHMRRTSFNSCTWRSHRNGTFKVATAGNFYTCRQRNNAFGRNWQDKQIWWWVLN